MIYKPCSIRIKYKIAKGLITKRIPKIIRLIIRHAPLVNIETGLTVICINQILFTSLHSPFSYVQTESQTSMGDMNCSVSSWNCVKGLSATTFRP